METEKGMMEDKIKEVVKEAAGSMELPDEALEQIAGGLATDLATRFKEAGLELPAGEHISDSDSVVFS